MQSDLNKQYFKIIALLSLAIAVTIRFEMILSYFFVEIDGHHGRQVVISFAHFGMEIIISYIVAFLMFTLNFFILNPVEKHNKLRFPRVALAIVLTFVSVSILNFLLFSVKNIIDPASRPLGHRGEFDLRNFFVSSLVIGGVLIIRLVFQKQTFMLENESLKRESLQSQYESLKNQLSPHFLFNSLTALQVLIKDAPDKAQLYVNSLSKALRYTLQSNEKQLVTLEEEMRFMESYLFLIRMRFDTNLTIETQIAEEHYVFRLPPLTVQTLVENAIKHNEISKRNSLHIRIITTEKDTLEITNNINKKLTEEEGTGIGLNNLSKQIHLLIGKEIKISRENDLFRVEVPLIKE